MVTATEALGATRAQEVPPTRVHHRMPPDILASEEAPTAAFALMLSFSHHGPWGWSTSVRTQVLEQCGHTLKHLMTNLTGEVTDGRGGMCTHVASKTQTGVVTLSTFFTLQFLLVGVVGLEMAV